MKSKYAIVNNNDTIIGRCDKEEAYEKKYMLRSVQIFVFDSKNRIVIQRRSKNKKRFPGYWCAATAGHVEDGESYNEAAARELKEELGITGTPKFITKNKTPVGNGVFGRMAHYTLVCDNDLTVQDEEIEEVHHVTVKKLKQMVGDDKPFTPSFLYYFDHIIKKDDSS